MNEYWKDRLAASQKAIGDKNTKEVEKQLIKYYRRAAKRVIADFESTYDKILAAQAAGKQITPADLYKLDRYWKLQGQMRDELRRMGEKEVAALTKQFELQFFDVYYSYALDGRTAYSTLDVEGVRQLLSSVWVADGKTYSQRVWDNVSSLIEMLNEELINCVASGKKTTDLKKMLQERFNVAYYKADTLVRTEMAHITTEAAKKRYNDYGIKRVQVWADEDERRCEKCGKLHQKYYNVGEQVPVPNHPNCRCCIVPVIE